jgi:type VI protein secretion system component VasF
MSKFLKLVSKYNVLLEADDQIDPTLSEIGQDAPQAGTEPVQPTPESENVQSALPSVSNDDLRKFIDIAKELIDANKDLFTDADNLKNILNNTSDDSIVKTVEDFLQQYQQSKIVKDKDSNTEE